MKPDALARMSKTRAALLAVAMLQGCVNAAADPAEEVKVPREGEGLFQERCAACHDGGIPGIPTRAKLGTFSSDQIISALTEGLMFEQAYGLSADEISEIARYIADPGN